VSGQTGLKTEGLEGKTMNHKVISSCLSEARGGFAARAVEGAFARIDEVRHEVDPP